jgi:hypothetical protein
MMDLIVKKDNKKMVSPLMAICCGEARTIRPTIATRTIVTNIFSISEIKM